MFRSLILVIFAAGFSQFAFADNTCQAVCQIATKSAQFYFDRASALKNREGREQCYRLGGYVETASPSYDRCYLQSRRAEHVASTDINLWLAQNNLQKACSDKYDVSNDGSGGYVLTTLENVVCD